MGYGTTVCGLALPKAALSPSPSPSVVPVPRAPFVRPTFNNSLAQVKLLPVDNKGGVSADALPAEFEFLSIEEVTLSNTVVASFPLSQVPWVEENFVPTVGGGIHNSTGVTALGFKSVLANNVTVRYSFFSFNRSLDIPVGSNFVLSVTPAFLKFSLQLTAWPWLDSFNGLRFTIGVKPTFTSARKAIDFPQRDASTIVLDLDPLTSAEPETATSSVVVRLINFGISGDGEKVIVDADADMTASALVFSVGQFSGNLSYDPDLSVLVGGRNDDDSGDDNLALIVAVSIAVPVAIVVVLVVIIVVVVIARIKSRRDHGGAHMVQIGDVEEESHNQAL